jgi:hypothetical protein
VSFKSGEANPKDRIHDVAICHTPFITDFIPFIKKNKKCFAAIECWCIFAQFNFIPKVVLPPYTTHQNVNNFAEKHLAVSDILLNTHSAKSER